jgi:hypothetical protein
MRDEMTKPNHRNARPSNRSIAGPIPRLIALLLVLTLSVDALAAGLVARLDRTRVVEGDAVVLTLSASGDSDGLPDLTPLQQDFDLLNQGQSTHMQIVNGRSSSSREWHLTLMPKRTGTIQIPAIAFGAGKSRPLTLEVLPAAQAAKQGIPRPVLVEVEAEPKQPYVQQKVVYTVRVLFATPLRDPVLSEPQVGNALVQRLGEEKRYDTYRNGQQYQVLERRYAILPQYSGALKIGAPVLNARVQEPGQRGNSPRDRFFGRDPFAGLGGFPDVFGMSGQTRPVQLRGEELTLDVQPQPAGTPTPWLPAESLTLNETWSANPPVFRVGEPVTRSIAITAQGLTGEQLPELDLTVAPGMKVYPDKSRAETRADKDTLVAQKVLRAAFVPSQAGDLTLPEIRIAWWDTASHQTQVARLPARTVQVLPAAEGSTALAPPPAPSRALAAGPGTADAARAALKSAAPGAASRAADSAAWSGAGSGQSGGWFGSLWPWVAVLFAAAWLVSTWLWWRARGAAAQPVPVPPLPARAPRAPAASQALARIEQAFRRNDPKAARTALLEWARGRWPDDPPHGLEMLAQRLLRDAAPVLQEIDRRLYDGSSRDWDGAAAWRRLSPLLGRGQSASHQGAGEGPLPPLYPTQS